MRTERLHKAGGGLITLIRDNITFTTTNIPSTINTHNTKLQMVKLHINNTKHITIANIYIPPRDTTSTHYKTADTDIQHCIQYITNIPHSVLTGDVNAHCTLWHSYTDDHRGQLITDVISNSDHITLTPQPECQTPHYNLSLRPPYPPTYTLPTNIILMADKHNIPKGKMRSNCRLLPEDIVCKITQRNNIRRANTCDPALKLLNEEITSDIQKHKQNIWKEHLDAHWDHRHNTHTLWKTIHGLSNRAPPHTLNTVIHAKHKTNRHINRATHNIQGYNITLHLTHLTPLYK